MADDTAAEEYGFLLDYFPLYRKLTAAARQRALAEGEKVGRTAGLDDGFRLGRNAGMREAARLTLAGRFTNLEDDILQTLDAASEIRVRDLCAHLASDTIEQLRQRLGLK